MTLSFEFVAAQLRPLGEHQDLALASRALPDGAYTTLRTYRGRVLRLADHVRRLEGSVALEGCPAQLEAATVRRAVGLTLSLTRYPESRLRLTFAPPRLFVSIEPFSPLPEPLYRQGVTAATLPFHRENPGAKDTRFIATAAGAYARLPDGVHEGLLLGEGGEILEGLTSNFFGIREGVLRTAEGGALPGITRELVLEVAAGLLPISKAALQRHELPGLSEAFLTSASRGILPLVRIDEIRVGSGRPGPLTQGLMARLELLIEREAEPL
ncbi:MAG TPA: aminotransferase class IV [Vicinamibacteria bacterium]|nr:aminotransferase class IV [Vicinamibacteria bacterium]